MTTYEQICIPFWMKDGLTRFLLICDACDNESSPTKLNDVSDNKSEGRACLRFPWRGTGNSCRLRKATYVTPSESGFYELSQLLSSCECHQTLANIFGRRNLFIAKLNTALAVSLQVVSWKLFHTVRCWPSNIITYLTFNFDKFACILFFTNDVH